MAAECCKRFSLVVAVSRNNGIGYENRLPWPRIKTDLERLETITTKTDDPQKQNAVIMGRKTWLSLRPMNGRYVIVLTSKPSSEVPGAHMVSHSLQSCVDSVSAPPLSDQIESVYILGGSLIYEEALQSPLCDKVYYTDVMDEFPCDVFFKWPNKENFTIIQDKEYSDEIIEENGVKYRFILYQRNTTRSEA